MKNDAFLEIKLEPGPSIGNKPRQLQLLLNDTKQVVAVEPMAGQETVTFKLPNELSEKIVKLYVDSENLSVSNDPRILNFRVFQMKIVNK